MEAVSLAEAWEPRRDFLIGYCGKTEIEAERTGWVELRALEKAHDERRCDGWRRARMIAHVVYLYAPVFSKNVRKEVDPTKWYPLPGDEKIEAEQERTVIEISHNEIKELNRIKALIR